MASNRIGSRARFSVSDDIELLREVRESNAFAHPAKWTDIARTLSQYCKKIFTVRAVRERPELLLSQYAANDRVNLRKSGTEEEYSEKEQLLQELLDMARDAGYKIRAPRRAKIAEPASKRTPGAQARNSAVDSFDTIDDSQSQPCAGAQEEFSSHVQLFAIDEDGNLTLQDEDLSFTSCASIADADGSDPQRTATANEGQPHTSSDASCSRPAARSELQRGKRKQDSVDYEFLEKRMNHDILMKEKDIMVENRRLALEESRISWERERTLIEVQLKEAEIKRKAEKHAAQVRVQDELRKELAEESRRSAAQQQAVMNIVDRLLSKIDSSFILCFVLSPCF